jgi:hypothetical protein
MKCWNCLFENVSKAHRCVQCDQPLKPNAAQQISSRRNLEYLLHEVTHWKFLDESAKRQIQSIYGVRQVRLSEANSKNSISWPETDWTNVSIPDVELTPEPPRPELSAPMEVPEKAPEPSRESSIEEPEATTVDEEETEPVPRSKDVPPSPPPAQQVTQVLSPASFTPSEPVAPNYLESLVGEADIRWFHSLGALLVVAAVVGWLRASWDSYGRVLTGLFIALSPATLHFISNRLKKSVPLSARLLSILANVLTPPALLALDIFGALPDGVPSDLYWTFAMLVSSAILCWQADVTKEKVPLYVGALCCVMAGWSQGALATATFSLAIGFLFAKESRDADATWQAQRRAVSFYAGSFGAFATLLLFETSHHPAVPLVAFTAALVFVSLPTLTGAQEPSNQGTRLFLQTSLTIIASILMRASLGLSPGGVALYLLFAAALFLTVKPDSPFAATAAQLAAAVGILGVMIGFCSNFEAILKAQQTLPEATLRFLFAGLGAVFFLKASRKRTDLSQYQPLLLTSLLCLTGGWLHLFFYFIASDGVSKVQDFVPLLASMPLFYALVIGGSRWLRKNEAAVVWSYTFPLLLISFGLTVLGQFLAPGRLLTWPLALLLHAVLAFTWEQGWLSPAPEDGGQEYAVIATTLPRIALAALTLGFYFAGFFRPDVSLGIILAAHFAAVYTLKAAYREAAWEAGWLSLGFTLVVFQHSWSLLAVSLASGLLAHAYPNRKLISLPLTCIYGTVTIALVAPTLPFYVLFLPAIAFGIAAVLPGLGEAEWADIGQARHGFDVLLCAAIVLGELPPAGTPFNLFYCLLLAGLAGGFYFVRNRTPLNRVLSDATPAAIICTLFGWSLFQTTLETGALLVLLGLFVAQFSQHQHRLEFANGAFLMGIAQLASKTHFMFDPTVIAMGVLGIEVSTLLSRKRSPQISNIVLLVLAFLQQAPTIWPEGLTGCLITATLIVAARAVQQEQHVVAAVSTVLFLLKLDSLPQAELLDMKYRLLPTAIILIVGGLWKWRSKEAWPRPALQLGLGLMVAPALLEFAGGLNKLENFVWTLVVGSVYVALHFATPEGLNRIFRQAGGYTLTAWAVVSLTRAALALPWQAATLVIGLVLVAVGILVEKKRRGESSRPPDESAPDESTS